MKRTAILFFSLASAVALQAQNNKVPIENNISETPQNALQPATLINSEPRAESSVTYWSEDFANGIPAAWSQNGSPALALWEYRGTGTAPNNTVGTRGAFGTNINPINSATTANGFVIFDSDYYDNGGVAANSGSGPVPTPHIGRLITDSIDLSGQSLVELKFESYVRNFFSDFFIAFSIDGGLTYTDTIQLYDDVDVNSSTPNVQVSTFNVSSIIGSQSDVRIQFIYAGNTPGNNNGTGYYFWMLDDVELRSLPDNDLRLEATLDNNGDVEAPAFDLIYDTPGTGYPEYGIMHSNQIVPIIFDANIYNYGRLTQTNVSLEVDIVDRATNTVLTTLTTTGCPTLAPGDTCDFNNLTTAPWTPPSAATDIKIVFKPVSAAISSAMASEDDTVDLFISDTQYSLDRNNLDNRVGSASLLAGVQAALVQFYLKNEDPDSTGSGLVFVEGLRVAFTDDTDSTADVEIAIYDTTGVDFANNAFPQPVFSNFYTLTGTAGVGNVLLTLPIGEEDSIYDNATQTWTEAFNPIALPTGVYYVVMSMFPNAANGAVRFFNDQTPQPGLASLLQRSDGSWFGGFTGGAYESPWIRLRIADAPAYNISIKENELNNFSVYPNPTNGVGNIQFEMKGTYSIRVVDMVGNVITNQTENVQTNERVALDLSNVPAGVYLVSVEGNGVNKTVKLTVQ